MTEEVDPRDELRAAIDGLTQEQARTLLEWARIIRHERGALGEGRSMGPLGDLLGIASEVQESGRSRMRLTIDPAWHNPNGVLHGGVIYTMVDYSMGGAVQSALPEGQYCATIEVKINYLAPVRDGTLTVETDVVRQGRNIAFTESKVRDERGRLVVTASGSMFIIRPGSQE